MRTFGRRHAPDRDPPSRGADGSRGRRRRAPSDRLGYLFRRPRPPRRNRSTPETLHGCGCGDPKCRSIPGRDLRPDPAVQRLRQIDIPITGPLLSTTIECHRTGHYRPPKPNRPPPGRDQGVDRRRADPRNVSAAGALYIAALFLAEEGSCRRRGQQVRRQAGEEAPEDVGRGEESGIGTDDRLLGAAKGRQEVAGVLQAPRAPPRIENTCPRTRTSTRRSG